MSMNRTSWSYMFWMHFCKVFIPVYHKTGPRSTRVISKINWHVFRGLTCIRSCIIIVYDIFEVHRKSHECHATDVRNCVLSPDYTVYVRHNTTLTYHRLWFTAAVDSTRVTWPSISTFWYSKGLRPNIGLGANTEVNQCCTTHAANRQQT